MKRSTVHIGRTAAPHEIPLLRGRRPRRVDRAWRRILVAALCLVCWRSGLAPLPADATWIPHAAAWAGWARSVPTSGPAARLAVSGVGEGAWVELGTPDGDAPLVLHIDDTFAEVEDAVVSLDGWLRGPAVVCVGGLEIGIECRRIYWPVVSEVDWMPGPGQHVSGGVTLTGRPVTGARVSVAPVDFEPGGPFVMPLGVASPNSARLRRAVPTDDEGQFLLPPLRAGRYRLEVALPNGRLVHGEPFTIGPVPSSADQGAEDVDVLDLGVLDIRDGLGILVEVVDDLGAAVGGALVSASEGTTPASAALFEAVAGAEGTVELAGFTATRAGRLRCAAPGHRSTEVSWTLVPSSWLCALERLADVRGLVSAADGTVPAGARLVLEPRPEIEDPDRDAEDPPPSFDVPVARPQPASSRSVTIGTDGTFRIRDLVPGRWALVAAAPGHSSVTRDIVVDPGATTELGDLLLRPAPERQGVVIDSETEAPVVGASVTSIVPVGAVAISSDEDGAFSFVDPGDGTLRVRVEHPDYAPVDALVPSRQAGERAPGDFVPAGGDPPRDPDRPWTVRLTRGGRLLVVVWDAHTGTACQGCPIRVDPGGHRFETDAAGEVESPMLRPGRYRVEHRTPASRGRVSFEMPGADVRHATVRPEGVTPVWFGERRRTVVVTLSPSTVEDWWLSAESDRRSQRVAPDDRGRYRFEQEADESLLVYLERFDPASRGRTLVRQTEIVAPATAGLDLDSETEIDWTPPSTAVEGHASLGGAAFGGASVRLFSLSDRALMAGGRTDRAGRFSLPHILPGVYALEIAGRAVRIVAIGSRDTEDLGSIDVENSGFDVGSAIRLKGVSVPD